MLDLATLTAGDLLRIPASEPERLFAPDRTAVDRAFRTLAATWHPDRSGHAQATVVFQHVAALRHSALERLRRGEWHEPGCLTLAARDGRTHCLRYLRRRPFELGDLHVGADSAAWIVERAHADLVDIALHRIDGFCFADDAMRRAVSRYLPVVTRTVDTAERRVVMVRKPADMILLADLLQHAGGTLDARHVAWILSELHCFACWLEWAGLTHNAIAPDTVFVSPAHHAVAVLGGWWYATPVRARLKALPARTLNLAPADIIRRKAADSRVDLDLIRALGREMLGYPTGIAPARGSRIPAALDTWLGLASNGLARSDYALWKRVLTDAFGVRRFTPLNIKPEDVYR